MIDYIPWFTVTNARKKETYKHVQSNLQTQFYHSFTAAIHNSVSLTNVENFNYLRLFLVDEALHYISGLPFTSDSYEIALKLLKHSYGNNKKIISGHMNALAKLTKVRNDDIHGLRKFFMMSSNRLYAACHHLESKLARRAR